MCVPTPPLLPIVIVAPLMVTLQPAGWGWPSPPSFQHSKLSMVADAAAQEPSAVAVNEIGACGGVMVAGLLQEITGGSLSSSITVTVASQEAESSPSKTNRVTVVLPAR